MRISGISDRKTFQNGRSVKRLLTAVLVLGCLMGLTAPAVLATEPGEAVFTVKQVFSYTGMPPSQVFSYKLTPQLSANPMPDIGVEPNGSFTITGTADKSIAIIFTQRGTYVYTINHTTTSTSGYMYDQTVYTLEIYVRSDLSVTMVYKKGQDKVTEIKYSHAYTYNQKPNDPDDRVNPPGPRPSDPNNMADPPVVKTVQGNPSTASDFTFRLIASDPLTHPMPAGSVNGVKTLTITGSGQKEFGPWSYTKAGTYYYTVSEVNGGDSSYTYDTAVYTITDSVKAVDGQLVVTRVVTNNTNKPVTSCSFINIYKGETPDPIPGPGGPKTGDDTSTMLYIALFCIAGVVAAGSVGYLLLAGRRRKKERK